MRRQNPRSLSKKEDVPVSAVHLIDQTQQLLLELNQVVDELTNLLKVDDPYDDPKRRP